MGYGFMPDITDEKVVCQKACEHTDCDYWRKFNKNCTLCDKPILAGRAVFYSKTDPKRFDHAHCVYDREKASNFHKFDT